MGLFNRLKTLLNPEEKKKLRRKPAKRTKKKPQAKVRKKASLKSKKAAKPKAQKKTKKRPPKKARPKKSTKPLKKAPKEKEIGVITHYFGKISVGIIKLKSALRVGDKIHIKGAHDDFTQLIKSMQINHKDILNAKKGDEVGVKISKPAHDNDKVYKI